MQLLTYITLLDDIYQTGLKRNRELSDPVSEEHYSGLAGMVAGIQARPA